MKILALILLVTAFITATVLTAVVKWFAIVYGFVAHPQEDRYHRDVVPLGGGIAIFSTLALALIAGMIIVKFFIASGSLDNMLGEAITIHAAGFLEKVPQLFVVLLCIAALFTIGIADDRKSLGPFVKLAGQFTVAFIAAILADIRVEMFIESKIITSFLSAFWIVMIINVFNFLDNMDGASAGMAVICSAILFIAAAMSGQVFVGAMALLFIGTLLGFLVFNFPPAQIFMGDAGSMVVGFMVALLTLRTTYYHEAQSGAWYPVMMPLIVLAVPLYDFTSVTVLRLMQGKSPFVGDTQHFSHRLRRRGLSDTQTVLTLYLATLVCGLGAVFLYQVNFIGAILIFAQMLLILVIIAILESASNSDID